MVLAGMTVRRGDVVTRARYFVTRLLESPALSISSGRVRLWAVGRLCLS